MDTHFLARCFARWYIRRQGRPANSSCSDAPPLSCEKRRPSSFIPLLIKRIRPPRPGMCRDRGMLLEMLEEICTGLGHRILRARPEYLQAQGPASKPYRSRGIYGERGFQTFQGHLQADLS